MNQISVIMPLYNAEEYIRQTIQSILNQTYSDFEFIIVDDCSTDNSVEIVKSISDSRVQLFYNETNKGISYTRNRALDLCTGKYIAIMDDDDIAPDYRFEDEVKLLEKYPDIDIVLGNTCIIDDNNNVVGLFAPILRNPKLLKAHLMFGNNIGNSTALIRRDFIEKYQIKYRDDMYGTEDYRFWAECSLYGNILGFDKVMLYWRNHDNESRKTRNSLERKQAIMDTQKYLLDSYGFKFTDKQYNFLFRVFGEDGILQSKDDINELYTIFLLLIDQAKKLKFDNVKEIIITCRKLFGKKCSTAFFLWDNEKVI